jgi:hypothetical protein
MPIDSGEVHERWRAEQTGLQEERRQCAAEIVRNLRLDFALRATRQTQTSLARRTGLPIWRVNRIVSGRARTRPEEREAIADALKLPVVALFGDADSEA